MMRFFKYWIFSYLFFISIPCISQEKVNLIEHDDVERTLDSIEYWIENDYLDKALAIIDETETVIEKNKVDKDIARVYRLRSALYLYMNDYNAFRDYLNKSIRMQQKVMDPYGGIFLDNLKGLFYKKVEKNNDEAANYFLKAIKAGEKKGYEEEIIDIYFNLTSIYLLEKKWKECYDISINAIKLAKKYKKNSRLIMLYYYRGRACTELEKFEEAKKSFEYGGAIADKLSDSLKTTNFANYPLYLLGFANLYERQKEYDNAIRYYKDYTRELAINNNRFLKKYSETINTYKDLQIIRAENEKNKIEIASQKHQLKLKNYLMLAALVIIAALVFIVFLQLKISRFKTKTNNLLKEKNSELYNAKKEIEESYRQKTLFINNISHELRTPLHAINGLSYIIQSEETSLSETRKYLDKIQSAGKYLTRFVNDIIEMNTIKNPNHYFLKGKVFTWSELINEIQNSFIFFIFEENKNRYNFNLDPTLSYKYVGDDQYISRILISILSGVSNFIRSADIDVNIKSKDVENGKNLISFSTQSRMLKFSEEQIEKLNNILSEDKSVVFSAVSDENNKAMLDLAVGNKLLRNIGSRLCINSSFEEGTSFEFELSLDISQKKIDSKNHQSNTNFMKKLLVVDDDKVNRLIAQKIITGFGYDCDIASSGYEAIDMIEKKEYNLIFMDIMMDGIDGFETTKRIRGQGNDIPIIALTAISENQNRYFFDEAGITRIVNKPYAPLELKNIIEGSLFD